ncbi:MAG: tRNA preQ1(34) S-adenosylmethionine ribosyltransferase-isomerase QueA [Myxococcales bacterium]|nr:tRNA preQ1(34) S-adenosylmethionine ribosyltransferase-isomerase QueA [Myxococcales bacterium]
MHTKADFAFELPPGQIAQAPAPTRDGSRLLVVGEPLIDTRFPALIDHLPPEAVVIVNDARVVPARVHGRRPSGGAAEVLFVEPAAADEPVPPGHVGWRCLVRAGGKLHPGDPITAARDPAVALRVASARGEGGAVTIAVPVATVPDVYALLDRIGELPLPPYIERAGGPDAVDAERYQTVYARTPGAVAAPTAGLHLTPAVLDAIAARGGTIATVTLHVGLGTFAPIRTDDLAAHAMHVERYDVPAATAALIASGRPVVAIGTTVVRTLESAATGPRQVAVGPGATSLFIRPGVGYQFQIVDALVTNFHLPESTLLMLVAAFAGYDRVMAAYRHAVAAGYRFFSYGDAMLVRREAP